MPTLNLNLTLHNLHENLGLEKTTKIFLPRGCGYHFHHIHHTTTVFSSPEIGPFSFNANSGRICRRPPGRQLVVDVDAVVTPQQYDAASAMLHLQRSPSPAATSPSPSDSSSASESSSSSEHVVPLQMTRHHNVPPCIGKRRKCYGYLSISKTLRLPLPPRLQPAVNSF